MSPTLRKAEIKKIEKLIYSFVNGARNLYGPERIARLTLKAPKDLGGIGGIDVDSFIKAIVVKQFDKAARMHRILGLLQGMVEAPLDDISIDARVVLRNNLRSSADFVAIPDMGQLELISGIPMTALLAPGSRASRMSDLEQISSLASLQLAFDDRRRARSRMSLILKAIPRSMAALIRSGDLIQVPVKLVWFNNDITPMEDVMTKQIKLDILTKKAPNIGVRLEKIYKRADWPPPTPNLNSNAELTFKHLWEIKNPTLRAIRLKISYKDVFSNERRFRFNLTDSPACSVCGTIESVEHQLFTCCNAVRIWSLFYKMTNVRIGNLYEVIICDNDIAVEIIKSTLIKALIQIDRSQVRTERDIAMECLYFLGIEARSNRRKAANLQQYVSKISNMQW